MKNPIQNSIRLLALIGALVSVTASAEPTKLTGAGATFPFPIYSKWFDTYSAEKKDVQINYQSVGSGAGITRFLDKTIDFGGTDAPMSDEEITKAGQPVFHIPTVLGAVVVTYNLAEVTQPLQLTSEVLAGIYLGKIKKWDDAAIKKINPKAALPSKDILVAYRSDGSGTTGVFTDYLAKVSPEWKSSVGQGKSVKWPVGIGGKGNEGVTGVVKGTPGAIGYVELIYAKQNALPVSFLKNKSGSFVEPSPKSVSAAAAGAMKTIPADFRVSITDATGKDAYPISAFTYLLVYPKMDAEKGKVMKAFLHWAMKEGQKMAEPLQYAPLPSALVGKVEAQINKIGMMK